jgi:hypothetical protein
MHNADPTIRGIFRVDRELHWKRSMPEISKLPVDLTGALKQVFRSHAVDIVPMDDGRRAIRLVAHDGPAVVVGWADLDSKRAELSTLGHALSLSKEQLGRELRLPPVEYLRFLEQAAAVLVDCGMTVTIVTHATSKSSPPSPLATTMRGATSSAAPYYGVIAASASLIGAIAWLIAH